MPFRPLSTRPATDDDVFVAELATDTPFVGQMAAVVDAAGLLVGLIDECPSVLWCDAFGAEELLDILEEDQS